jgi:predicted MFS family arabinose efflux permease
VTAPDPDERPASAWELLRRPNYLRYFLGNIASNIGTWFQDIAAAILVFQLTGSATAVALVAICGYGTAVLLAPWGGSLADRFDRRLLLILSHWALALAAGTLAVLASVGLATAVVVYVVSAMIGVGRAINNPTLQAIIPALVRRQDVAQATALQVVTFNLARATGPVLGALVMTGFGAGPAFAVNAVSFAVFAVVLMTLRVEPRPKPTSPGGFRFALGYVRRRPRVVLLLVCCAVMGMSTDPVITLAPAFAAAYGEPEAWAGWFTSAFGAGAVLGAPFTGRVRRLLGPRRTGVVGMLIIPVAYGVVAFSPWPPLSLVAVGVAGAAFLIGNADLVAGLQEEVDDSVRGRVMALWTIGFHGSRPVAAGIDGTVADASTPQIAIAVIGGLILVTAILAALGFRRDRDSDAAPVP